MRPVRVNGNMIFKGHKLTIGVDLGDRWSNYCVLDEAGEVLLEQKLATTPEAMKHKAVNRNVGGSNPPGERRRPQTSPASLAPGQGLLHIGPKCFQSSCRRNDQGRHKYR